MKSSWLHSRAIVTGLVAVGTMAAAPAVAVTCGEVLSGPGSHRLDADLACNASPALTVRDGARLDLGGHTVTCTGGGDGIVLAGTRARLSNGVVTGCDDGIALSGSAHQVKRVRATFNTRGFVTDGTLDQSRLYDDGAEFNTRGGFLVVGADNSVTRNAAFGNGDVAIFVAGSGNTVSRNETNGNCIPGGCAAYVIGGDDNEVSRNSATGEDTGFLVMPGTGPGNVFRKNVALFSFVAGIVVQDGATGNLLTRNVATGGGGIGLFDFNLDCAGNVWKNNAFDTANQACID